MKILMIDVNGPLTGARGSNLVASILKNSGHEVITVTLTHYPYISYTANDLLKLKKVIDQVELAMISVFSPCGIRAIEITKIIREIKPGIKIIWGGPHCLSEPVLSTRYADIVCYSEAEQIIGDLAQRIENNESYLDIPNIAFEKNGRLRKNSLLPPIEDLDSLPYSDCDLSTQYVLTNELIKLTELDVGEHFDRYPFGEPTLMILASRGCPYRCSYCINAAYIKLFGRNFIRRRGTAHLIGELKQLLGVYNCCKKIAFGDDDFMTRPVEELKEFAEAYKREINLPFVILASADTFEEEKINILLDAGLKIIEMGVQTASERVLKDVYHRNISIRRIKEVIKKLDYHAQRSQLVVLLDFILDNPYETEKDIYKTFRFILGLPTYFRLNIFNLSFLPGTPIYARAIKDRIIMPYDYNDIRPYNSPIIYQKNYPTWLIRRLYLRRNSIKFAKYLFRIFGSKFFFYFRKAFFPLFVFLSNSKSDLDRLPG